MLQSWCCGGGKRDRTADLLHAMQALSQLSYGPTRAATLRNPSATVKRERPTGAPDEPSARAGLTIPFDETASADADVRLFRHLKQKSACD